VTAHTQTAAACAFVLLAPTLAFGTTTIKASATAQTEYTSNVFQMEPGTPIPGTQDFQHSDSFQVYGGELLLDHTWKAQDWTAILSASDFRYTHFTQLSHIEYKLYGNWKWQLGPQLEGTFNILRRKIMVPFADLIQVQYRLTTSIEQRETAAVGYQLVQHWRVEATGIERSLEEPLTAAPDLRLLESTLTGTLKYLGTAGLSWGLSASYLHGEYSHTNQTFNPAYDQKGTALVVTYLPTGRSNINASVGYSRRSSAADFDNVAGLTGHIAYSHQLTGKTSVAVAIDRDISSYLTTSGSEIDTSGRADLSWHPTYRIAIGASYTYTYSNFPSLAGAVLNRIDHLRYTSVNINYQARDWLVLRPYMNLQRRTSNVLAERYETTMYGIQLMTQWQNH
jgi:hypothetical protein